MKDVFDPESKKALIDYRIERAYETLKEAKYNSDGGFYHAAVNRMYYADTSRCSCNAGIALRVKRYIEQGGWKNIPRLV